MNIRRSLNSALTSTPDLNSPAIQAFISGGAPVKAAPKSPVNEVLAKPGEKPVEHVTLADEVSATKQTESKPKRSAKQRIAPQPVHSKLMISITTRLEQSTADALRRAHLEQKLKNVQPGTQQEIIEIAVQAWLLDHDYLP
ncbi:MAG TPA: hypothetical protein VGN12_15460 [Pirellulales bacterium]|jgi:hypothetical protein